jgi:prepilin-type N-terminal cleavage/methylation domain-containing protein
MRMGSRRSAAALGFTLVELMVALALAAMISVSIMFISSQARQAYEETAKIVDLYNRFRYVFRQIEEDFRHWLSTSDLEFFMDGRGKGGQLNGHWDPGEEVPDRRDQMGPAVVDGGTVEGSTTDRYDEYAYVIQRQYLSREPMQADKKVHDAYQAYFHSRVYVDGAIRQANVEYMLLDPSKVDERAGTMTIPPPPTDVEPSNVARLSLFKVVRYFDVTPTLINRLMETPITRKVIEVCSNVTDFRLEYLLEGDDVRGKAEPRFYTPEEEYKAPPEIAVRPQMLQHLGPLGGYKKTFGYGSMKLNVNFPRAIAEPGIRGDDGLVGITNPQPLRFGFKGDPSISFAQLVPGDRIFIFTASARGAAPVGAAAQSAGNATMLTRFPTGDYTVKTRIEGLLEFNEDIDTTEWMGRTQSNIYYKAPFLPSAVRITLRIVDDQGMNPKTLQRVVWIRRRSQ